MIKLNVVDMARGESQQTTYPGNLNEAGNNKQQFWKIPMCIS